MKLIHLRAFLTGVCRDERGATAIEYAMIGAMVSIAVIGIVTTIGSQVYDLFQSVVDEISP